MQKQSFLFHSVVQQCTLEKVKLSFMIPAQWEMIHRPLSLLRITDRGLLSLPLSLSCCQHFYISCLFAQTRFLGGLTLRIVPSLRSLAVSSGILNHAETALVLPKCSPVFALALATHQRHKTHCAQTLIFTQQLPLLVDPLST